MIEVRYAKGQKLLQERDVKWNSLSRIALGARSRLWLAHDLHRRRRIYASQSSTSTI